MTPTAYQTFLTDVDSIIVSLKTGIGFFNNEPVVYFVYLAFAASLIFMANGLIPKGKKK